MKKRLRFYAFAAGAIAISVGVFLAGLNDPASFLTDYGNTVGRMVSGDWQMSEVTEPERRRNDFQNRGQRRRGRDFGGVFAALDKNEDDLLSSDELGQRLSDTVLSSSTDTISLEQFRQTATSSWQPALNNAAKQTTGHTNERTVVEQQQTRLSANSLLDPKHVVQVDITIDETDWQTLCNQSRDHRSAMENPLAKPYTNFRADIVVDGVEIRDVAIRKKGFIGSQDRVRPSLKIKFDEYVDQAPIPGLDRLTLNNNKQDHSLVSQSLTYKIFRDANVPTPRCSFAAATVNGRYLGVYTHVESYRKPFLRNAFGDDSGNMYEGTLTDFYPKSIEWLEAKTNKDNDRAKIIDLANLLDSEATTLEEISSVVDIDNFLRYWAIESLINFWDGYTKNQNNYFAYENPGNNLIYFMPWGADSCFGRRPHFVHWGKQDVESLHATSILANRLLHIDGVPNAYREAMLEILASVWNEEQLEAEIKRIEDLLRDHVDFQQINSYSTRDDVRNFIRNRRAIVMQELDGDWPGPVPATPRIPQHIVEIGTANGTFSTNADDGSRVEGKLIVDGEETAIESIEIFENTMELVAVQDAHPITITLQLAEATTESTTVQVTGAVHDGRSWRQTRTLTGQVTFEKRDEELQTGKFEIKIIERRGGRW